MARRSKTQLAIDEAVAEALEQIAEQVREGVKLEAMDPGMRAGNWPVYLTVFDEIRDTLIQHRDHGTAADRVRNNDGMVLMETIWLPADVEGSPVRYAEYVTNHR
jgi:hypothetical protein